MAPIVTSPSSMLDMFEPTRGMGLEHLCQPCAHDGTSFSVIEGIRWQTTHHGEGMACHEDIGMT
jgi:hypothetical protein